VIIWALRFSSGRHSPPGATFSDRRLHKELEGELRRVEREREVLKKALAIFGRSE
jgi:transposase